MVGSGGEVGPSMPSGFKVVDTPVTIRKARPRPPSPSGSLESGSSIDLMTGQSCRNGSNMGHHRVRDQVKGEGSSPVMNGPGSKTTSRKKNKES